jgi:hypothetical protein
VAFCYESYVYISLFTYRPVFFVHCNSVLWELIPKQVSVDITYVLSWTVDFGFVYFISHLMFVIAVNGNLSVGRYVPQLWCSVWNNLCTIYGT